MRGFFVGARQNRPKGGVFCSTCVVTLIFQSRTSLCLCFFPSASVPSGLRKNKTSATLAWNIHEQTASCSKDECSNGEGSECIGTIFCVSAHFVAWSREPTYCTPFTMQCERCWARTNHGSAACQNAPNGGVSRAACLAMTHVSQVLPSECPFFSSAVFLWTSHLDVMVGT